MPVTRGLADGLALPLAELGLEVGVVAGEDEDDEDDAGVLELLQPAASATHVMPSRTANRLYGLIGSIPRR